MAWRAISASPCPQDHTAASAAAAAQIEAAATAATTAAAAFAAAAADDCGSRCRLLAVTDVDDRLAVAVFGEVIHLVLGPDR
jgi:hypothetical protein